MHLGYFQHQRIGDLMARMTNDLSAVRQMQGPGVMNVASTTMTFAFTIVSMLGVSVKLTLISVILMPLVSLTFWIIGRRVHVKFERLQAQFSEMSTTAQENFSGIRVVKAFSQENAEIARFAAVNEEYVRRAINLRRMDGLIWPTMSFILGLAVLASLAASHTQDLQGSGSGALAALNGGYHVAFLAGAVFALAAGAIGGAVFRVGLHEPSGTLAPAEGD
jgi:ATP-binding cassette subfamily B protein